MYYRITQRSKRWFKPKKVKKTVKVVGTWHNWRGDCFYTNEDFYNVQWTSYGGYNHTNRDRSGGHYQSMLADNLCCLWPDELGKKSRSYAKYRNRKSVRNTAKTQIKEGLQDFYDIQDEKIRRCPENVGRL